MSNLTYGFVLITRGKYRGRAAYYDDDQRGLCIVYFGAPCLSLWALIPPSNLNKISSAEAIRLGWRNEAAIAS